MYSIGIVGHGSNKFTKHSEQVARNLIKNILTLATIDHAEGVVVVSGHSPIGGIDIWTEEIANELELTMDIKAPKQHTWEGRYGYKARNLDIAKSDVVHVILVDSYPPGYQGRKFDQCYHCAKHSEMKTKHVKSGGCWTGWQSNHPIFHIIKGNNEERKEE